MLTQITVSHEFSLTGILFELFILSENQPYFISRMHFISICLIFLKLNECLFTFFLNCLHVCLHLYLRYQQQFTKYVPLF